MAASGVSVKWSDGSGKHCYAADGPRDVLIIVSEGEVAHPDVVRRRAAIELTEEMRGKLVNQGVTRHQQQDDLSIIKARYNLAKDCHVCGVEMSQPGAEQLTKERVLKQIAILMNNCSDAGGGVMLHYIGDGRRLTGDWCFHDGFITFAELAHLYIKGLQGRVLTIVSDCSHSGSWVRDCMAFLDQHGVGPCGHKAREKGILVNVYTSCLSHQIPRQLAFSVLTCKNDKNTGNMFFFKICSKPELESKIADAQHTVGINFTEVRCGQKSIDEECLCLPQADWNTWSASNRIYRVNGFDKGRKAWHLVLLVDDDCTILTFVETTQGENGGKFTTNLTDYGLVLKSGWGQEPAQDQEKSAKQKYQVYRDKPN